jgi:hypothetical protein
MKCTLYVVAKWTLAQGADMQSVEYITARTYAEAARKYSRTHHLSGGTLSIVDFNDIDGASSMRYDIRARYIY